MNDKAKKKSFSLGHCKECLAISGTHLYTQRFGVANVFCLRLTSFLLEIFLLGMKVPIFNTSFMIVTYFLVGVFGFLVTSTNLWKLFIF